VIQLQAVQRTDVILMQAVQHPRAALRPLQHGDVILMQAVQHPRAAKRPSDEGWRPMERIKKCPRTSELALGHFLFFPHGLQLNHIIPIPPAPAGAAGSGSLMMETADSVVNRVAAIEFAF